MPKLLRLILITAVSNVVALLAMDSIVYYYLDPYFYASEDQLYARGDLIKADIQQFDPENWAELPQFIAEKYDVYAEIMTLPEVPDKGAKSSIKNMENLQAKVFSMYSLPLLFHLTDDLYLSVSPKDSLISADNAFYISSVILVTFITFIILYLDIAKSARKADALRHSLSNTLKINNPSKDQDLALLVAELKAHLSDLERKQLVTISDQRDLFHGVAHEFRSPLAKIQFALEMLDEETQEGRTILIGKINKYISDLDHLIKELLFYSQLTTKNTENNYSTVNLHEVTQRAIDTVSSFYPNVTFENNVEQCMIQANEKLIERLILNLARNAGRFATKACRILTSFKDGQLILSVEDDGPGIPPEKRNDVFLPFSRLDSSRSRDSGGCGLGLAIVASIAKKHSAEVQVDTSLLGGAQVIVLFKKH